MAEQRRWEERIAILEETVRQSRRANDELSDIIEQLTADKKNLEEQLRKLTVAVEQNPVSVVITDQQGRIEYVNPKFTCVTGYTLAEAQGNNPRVLKSGDQSDTFYSDLWQQIVSGGEWRGEFHNKRKDGSLYWESAIIAPVKNDKGEITHFLAVKEDITERKMVQEELHFAYAQMNELFNSAADATVVVNLDGTIFLANETMARMIGTKKEELIGKKCQDVIANDLCGTAACSLRRILAGEERIDADTYLIHSGSRRIPGIFTAIPYKPDGKLMGIIISFKDMTERRRAEEAMRKDFLLGAQMQREFLPQPFRNQLAAVDVVYEPHGFVSGDLCDVLWLSDSKLFGYVIDVMGHGLATALQTSALRVLFHHAARNNAPLQEKMQRLNKTAMPYFGEDSFAGAICFELDFRAMTISYVAAGINVFIAATAERHGIVKVPGSLLGITEHPDFDVCTVPIQLGDAYYFMTDGLFDLLDETMLSYGHDYEATVRMLREKAVTSERWDDATALCLCVTAKSPWPYVLTFKSRQEFCNSRPRIRFILQQMAGERASLLEIAVNEAVNNAVRAAGQSDKVFVVKIKFHQIGRWLIIRITDSGAGFDGNGAVAAIDGAGCCDLFEKAMLQEGGRGIMIMKALFTKVVYNRTGNEILLAKDTETFDCMW